MYIGIIFLNFRILRNIVTILYKGAIYKREGIVAKTAPFLIFPDFALLFEINLIE